MHIVWGIIGILIAIALVYYRRQIISFTGPWGWAEKYIGTGQSQTACILLAVVVFIISLSIMTGAFDGVGSDAAKTLFGGGGQEKK